MILLLVASLVAIWWLTSSLYWWKRGVNFILPLPLLGNCLPLLYLGSADFYQQLYSKFPTAPYIGIHFFTRPVLLLRDPKIILEVLESQFNAFSSHGMYVNKERDPMGRSVFHQEASQWKDTRSKLSPHFSPSKVNTMITIGNASLEKLMAYIDKEIIKMAEPSASCVGVEIEMHSTAMMYSADFTAATIFGMETDAFINGKSSEFVTTARELNTPASMIKFLIGVVSPRLFDMLMLYSFTKRVNDFITVLVESSMESRLLSKSQRPDLMKGMMDLIDRNKAYDKKFVVSQGAVLWVGGVETTAATLSFALFELAANDKLQKKIRENLGNDDGLVLIKKVVSETLRKYPVFGVITRCCTEDCTLSTGLKLERGSLVVIPVLSLHRDPSHFPKPTAFRTDRLFPKGAYLPFGAGPRTCLGMRLAQASLERALRKLLAKYSFSLGARCKNPLSLEPRTFFTAPTDGIWLNVKAVS